MSSHLDDVIPVKINDEYKKNDKLRPEDIAELKQWYLSQPDYPDEVPEIGLALLLHSSDYNVPLAKKYIDNCIKLRTSTPEFFQNRDPRDPSIKGVFQLIDMWVAPKTTPENYYILYSGFIDTDPSTYNFADACKTFLMVGEAYVMKNGVVPGFIVILDAKGGSYRHVLKAKITLIRRFLSYVQDAIPIKIIQVHVININPVIDKIMILIKPFIKAALMDNIHFHSGMKGLYEYIPKDILPTDLGGSSGTREEYQRQSEIVLEELREWFLNDDIKNNIKMKNGKLKSDENESITDYEETHASFKSLDID